MADLRLTLRAEKSLDWTDKRISIKDRNAKYFANELRSDMVFNVERDNLRIPAHRLIVAGASPMLESIAYGTGNIVGTLGDVPVKDCSAEDFYEVLRFIYTDDCNITSSNAANILLLAHYYDLGVLEDMCIAHLMRTLSPDNVCKIFGRLYLMDNALTKQCLHVIQANTDELFNAADGETSLFDLELDALEQVFKFDVLCLDSDVELFEQLLKWGRLRSCDTNFDLDQPSSSNRLRETLDGRLQFIRFTAMTIEQFGQCIQMVDPSFFTNDEICTTYQRIVRGHHATDAEGMKTLVMYKQPREPYYGGEEWILPLEDKSSAISKFSIRISRTELSLYELYLNGFTIFSNDTRFTVVLCKDANNVGIVGEGDYTAHGELDTMIDFKIYGNRVMFEKPLIISFHLDLIITYDNFVKAKRIASESQHDNIILSESEISQSQPSQKLFPITFRSLLYSNTSSEE